MLVDIGRSYCKIVTKPGEPTMALRPIVDFEAKGVMNYGCKN